MSVLSVKSHLREVNPTDANGQTNPNSWDIGSVTRIYIDFSIGHRQSSGTCATGSDYLPIRKGMATIEDVTGDGFYLGQNPGPQPVGGSAFYHTDFYQQDGQYWSASGSTWGSGIPDITKVRTYEIVFVDGSSTQVGVLVQGLNTMRHKSYFINDPAILTAFPSFYGTVGSGGAAWAGAVKGAETIAFLGNSDYTNTHTPTPINGCPTVTNMAANTLNYKVWSVTNGNNLYIAKENTKETSYPYSLSGHSSNVAHPLIAGGGSVYGTNNHYVGDGIVKGMSASVVLDEDNRFGPYKELGWRKTEDAEWGTTRAINMDLYAAFAEEAFANSDHLTMGGGLAPGGNGHNGYPSASTLDPAFLNGYSHEMRWLGHYGIPNDVMSTTNTSGGLATEIRMIQSGWENQIISHAGGQGSSFATIVSALENFNSSHPGWKNFDWSPIAGVTYKQIGDGGNPCAANPVTITNSSIIVVHESTQGLNDGEITINTNSIGGTPGFTVLWSDSNGNNIGQGTSINNLSPGQYTVNVTDSNGCTDSFNITINSGSTPCQINCTTSISNNCGNSTLTLQTTQNTSSWNIVWYDPNNNVIPNTLAGQLSLTVDSSLYPGNYMAEVTDFSVQGNCSQIFHFLNVSSTPLSATATSVDVTIAGGNDGTATALVSGGTAPYTYLWTPGGQTTATATNLTAGIYSCQIIDANGCTSSVSIDVQEPTVHPLNASCLDVCLDLDNGVFDFIDNNNYSPSGPSLPYRIALTIEHSNGTIVHPGSLSNPDIFSDTDLSNLRTYNYSIKYGQNNSIPIPVSGSNYISDIYKVTTEWSFSGNAVADVTQVCYINAQGLANFNNLSIDTELIYSCTGDLVSKDNTIYGITGIPYTLSRVHKLFAPTTSGLPSPAYSTGTDLITHSLYEGVWSNFIETQITWTVPQTPSLGNTYEPVCIKKTLYGAAETNVECYIDPCVVQHYSKKIKNKYDKAVCDCDTLKIKKYRAQLQRIVELLNVYIIGEKSDCVNDFSELWTILGITYQDHLTDPNCCSTPNVNPNLTASGGCATGDCGDNPGTGNPPAGDPSDPPYSGCPCSDPDNPVSHWDSQQLSNYEIGDYVKFSLPDGSCVGCYQLANIPSTGWDSDYPDSEKPHTDGGAYWVLINCGSTLNNNDCYGCTDPTADNYDSSVIYDDGSCTYTPFTVYGCTDSSAVNYNANPNIVSDNNMCIYCEYGCSDSAAINFYGPPSSSQHIVCDDGSCCYTSGCTDPGATNYDANACNDDGSCIYAPAGCDSTNWTSILDPFGAPNGHPRFSGLYLDGSNNIWSLVRPRVHSGDSSLFGSGSNKITSANVSIGPNANVAAPDDYWIKGQQVPLAFNNANHDHPVSSQEMVLDSNGYYWIINGDEMQKWDKFPGMASAATANLWPSHSPGQGLSESGILHSDMVDTNSGPGWGWSIPSDMESAEKRYVTMDIDGSDIIHVLFGTFVIAGSFSSKKTYYYTFNTSTKVWALVDTLNESVSDCHLYWANNSSSVYTNTQGSGTQQTGSDIPNVEAEYTAVLRVDGSNKPWIASNGKLLKYDGGWKNIAGATATANGGDFHVHPTTGANTVFSVDKDGDIRNPGGPTTDNPWIFRDVVLDFVISGSNKYILTYSNRLFENASNDALLKKDDRKAELLLYIHNGSSWSVHPVPTRKTEATLGGVVSTNIETDVFWDNYGDHPGYYMKPTIAIKGTTPYVHCAFNKHNLDIPESFGETRFSWVQSLNVSTGAWTQVGEDFIYDEAFGQDSMGGSGGAVNAASWRHPITGLLYVSVTDDLIASYGESKTSGSNEWIGIKRICF